MDILKIAILGLAGVFLATALKGNKSEYGIYICFAVCVLIFMYVIVKLGELVSVMEQLSGELGENKNYISILLKVIGVTYICEFCAGISKDAGYHAIASQIEIFGKLSVLFMGMPILLALLDAIGQFAG